MANLDTVFATFGINEKCEQTNKLIAEDGVSVEIYRNFLYLSDEKAWHAESGYIKPIIMDILEGVLHYRATHIRAVRGPANGIYTFVEHYSYKKDAPLCISNRKYLLGCGVWAFDQQTNEVINGVTAESLHFLGDWFFSLWNSWSKGEQRDLFTEMLKKVKTMEIK